MRAQTPRGWRKQFLGMLAITGNVAASARHAGVDRTTAYRARRSDTKAGRSFADAWDRALEQATDRARQEQWRRAIAGVDRPVFHNGEVVGEIRQYSDRMLELILKSGPDTGEVAEAVASQDRAQMLRALLRRLARAVDRADDRELPGLTKQVVAVTAELQRTEPADESIVDDLSARRAARLADAAPQ